MVTRIVECSRKFCVSTPFHISIQKNEFVNKSSKENATKFPTPNLPVTLDDIKSNLQIADNTKTDALEKYSKNK